MTNQTGDDAPLKPELTADSGAPADGTTVVTTSTDNPEVVVGSSQSSPATGATSPSVVEAPVDGANASATASVTSSAPAPELATNSEAASETPPPTTSTPTAPVDDQADAPAVDPVAEAAQEIGQTQDTEPGSEAAQKSQAGANGAPTPAPTPQAKDPVGAFRVWTVDDKGEWVNFEPKEPIDETKKQKKRPDPASDNATDIYFSPTGPATDDQSKLYDDVSSVLDVVRRLYLPNGIRPNPSKFRTYYVRIFRLAQVGLTGTDPAPKQAKGALDSLKASLLDDEGLTVKTTNLSQLGKTALKFSLPLVLAYVFLLTVGPGEVENFLKKLQIARVAAAYTMLLWLGCFVGVCLSYGVRTSTLTLADLVTPGPDRLPPSLRLLFIGALTMFFGLLFMEKIVEFKVGSFSTASIGADPAPTFIVGILFGLSEAVLPGLAGKRAESFIKGLQ